METFSKVIRKLQELEDRYSILLKFEMFTDTSGEMRYLVDTRNVEWKFGFAFANLEDFNKGLVDFEDFIAG